MAPLRVTIVGSGNWGSAIAGIVGSTTKSNPDVFDPAVRMWVFEEIVNGEKLSEVINTRHENVKYLPGKILPDNVVAVTDLLQACGGANILIFVVPHQFVQGICEKLAGKLSPNTLAVSLIKGLSVHKEKMLVSEEINAILGIEVAVLMGANLALEVANNHFCESTLGSSSQPSHTA